MKNEQQIKELAASTIPEFGFDYAIKRRGFIAGYTACQDEDRWISVMDRLPEKINKFNESDHVICKDGIGVPFVAWYSYTELKWTVAHHYAESTAASVTDWKNLK